MGNDTPILILHILEVLMNHVDLTIIFWPFAAEHDSLLVRIALNYTLAIAFDVTVR